MDNRFGVKDFVLFSLIAALLVTVLLAMKQYDRQYEKIVTLDRRVGELADDLSRIDRKIGDLGKPGAFVPATGPAAASAPAPGNDPFGLVRAAAAMPGYAEGDWLVMNLGTRVGKITPIVSSDIYGSTVQARVLESLLVRDPLTTKWQPLLAESYVVSPDGLTVTYQLRKEARFSDGVPVTSADVKFTFDLILTPDLDAARARSYLTEQGVTCETAGDHTVIFRMAKPYFEFLSITGAQVVLPRHVYSKYTARQINDNPGLLMGSGPYRMEGADDWRPGKRLVLYRNERYWGPTPTFKRIVYYEVSEETVYSTMLRNGKLDYTGVTPEQFNALRKDETITSKCNELEFQSMLGGYTYIAWNQQRGGKATIFADKRVRQAMTLLIDRERMAKELWYGYASVATGPFSSKGPQSNPAVKAWPADAEAAKRLLAEAGWADRDGDGLLENAAGEPFKFEFMYSSGSALSSRIALYLKDQLAKGGVLAELKATDWPTLVENLKKSQFDVTSLGWSSSVESDLFQIFHSSQRGDAGDNRTGYSNPELDKAIEAARAEVDEAKRFALWHKCHEILHEDQPYTFLLERRSLAFYDKRIRNIQTTRMGLNFMATEPRLPPWFVPLAEQRYVAE